MNDLGFFLLLLYMQLLFNPASANFFKTPSLSPDPRCVRYYSWQHVENS